MNPGGIRADLTYANSPYGEAPGDVTYEEAFTVQPFNNYLVSMTLTGEQIKAILGQQWTGSNAGSNRRCSRSQGLLLQLLRHDPRCRDARTAARSSTASPTAS